MLAEGVADPRMHWQGRGSSWQYLERASYVQAVCWAGLCAAEALHYAHGQGLLHLDLKPSNLLLTADGQPMLLDFHLAREPLPAGVPVHEPPGGTPAYMSPEQRSAWQASSLGRPLDAGVDGRSDVYSLALVLVEALGGGPRGVKEDESPFAGRELRYLPTGLRDIFRRALKTDPADRYPDAAALAEDLRRHLSDRPLVGVRNRNPAEWWVKWRHRSPHALRAVALMLTVAMVSGVFARFAWNSDRQRAADAAEALYVGKEQLSRREYAEAAATLQRCAALLKDTFSGRELTVELKHAQSLATRGQALSTLGRHVRKLRFAYGNESLAPDTIRAFEHFCRDTWDARGQLLDAAAGPLRSDEEEQLRTDLLDVAVILADLLPRLAAPQETDAALQQAVTVLSQAEALLGPSAVIARARRALGQPVSGDDPEPRSALEHYVVGRWLYRAGDLAGARGELEQAVALRPQEFWPWFWRGLCAYKLRRFEDAVSSFSVCIALSPDSAECFCNRAIARFGLGQATEARADYDKAVALDAGLPAAALNRGILNLQEKRLAEAEGDLGRALTLGADPAVVYFNLAVLCQRRHDRQGSLANVDKALRYRPAYPDARNLRGRILDSRQ
jgi:tetratricopeptide (TPR) repeat protein